MIKLESRTVDDLEIWLQLWGAQCRSIDANLGYPKAEPYYTPPRRYADEVTDPRDPTDYDRAQAERVNRLISAIEHSEPQPIAALREYYGAYQTTETRKARIERYLQSHTPAMKKREFYSLCDIGRQLVKGALLVL